MKQLSLLGDQELRPEGLFLYPDFISPAEEQLLSREIEKLEWEQVRMHGVIAKRRVKHYGLNYGYESWKLEPTEPVPDFLKPFMVKAAPLMKTTPDKIVEVLISEYPVGAGIGWHRDAPMFGDSVFGLSLGSSCVMKFRRAKDQGFEICKVELEPRAAYVISGPARRIWQHHIAPVKTKRSSITFRTLAGS